MVRKPWRRLLPALLSFVLLSGCATYSSTVGELERQLAAGNPTAALASLEQRQTPERDRVLYLLDKAMLLRLSGDFGKSNEAFEAAKVLMDRLSAASASETAGSFLINDATRSYVGAPFEQALLHAYAALNYLDLQALGEARVEALQVEERLKQLSREEGPLAQDPFARYLAGMIFEAQGEASDALIFYRDAFKSYEAHAGLYGAAVPEALKRDLLRLTEKMGLRGEHKALAKRFGDVQWPKAKEYAEKGELVFFLHSGLAPIKREHISVIYPPTSEFVVSVALPSYQIRANPVARARLVLGDESTETEQVENVGGIASATLKHEMPAITARGIARAVAKYRLAAEAKKQGSRGAGLIANLAGLLMERADTRSWLTLPGEVQMARILVPAGDYRLRVEMVAGSGAVLGTREFDVHIENGKKTFLSSHWVPSMAAGRKL